VDLEHPDGSGLTDALGRLSAIEGVSFVRLDRLDIVRHRLVQNIVNAYANGKA
jgi:phosphate starvation-inducible protein PhoH and related proteins